MSTSPDLGAQLYAWGVFTSLWNQIACVRFSDAHGPHCCCSVCRRADRLRDTATQIYAGGATLATAAKEGK